MPDPRLREVLEVIHSRSWPGPRGSRRRTRATTSPRTNRWSSPGPSYRSPRSRRRRA